MLCFELWVSGVVGDLGFGCGFGLGVAGLLDCGCCALLFGVSGLVWTYDVCSLGFCWILFAACRCGF